MLAIGVVNEGYNTSKMPGWENGTVGYYSEGIIFDAQNRHSGRGTKGIMQQRINKYAIPEYIVPSVSKQVLVQNLWK